VFSIRELADRHNVHRPTVRQAVESAVPPPRKRYPPRPRQAIDAYAAVIDAWLLADMEMSRKQRHTARRLGLERAGASIAIVGSPASVRTPATQTISP